MSISELTGGASPAQTLAGVLATVRDAAAALWSARTDAELLDTVGLVAQLTSALAAV